MATRAIEKAFQRHPRPQVPRLSIIDAPLNKLQIPTKAALLEKSLQKGKEICEDPWKTLFLQGELIQGRSKWYLCIHEGLMAIVKEVEIESGRQELEKIKKISDHRHVSTIKQIFESENSLFFRFEYSRFTLEEVLNVHLCLEEIHIRVISSSV
jgi:hypothetical protein